ncbi:MAG: outer membrane protein assembly factor BamC [Burkholderiales bacterium]
MRRRAAAAALLALAVAGCSSTDGYRDGASRIEYKTAQKLPPLDVPPDLTAPGREGRFDVPEPGRGATTLSGYQAGLAQQQPRAGAEPVLPAVEGVRVARDGDQRWLVVNQPPEALWPMLKTFWQENGLLIAREVPEAGVMETGWSENRAKIPDSWIRRTLGSLIEPLQSTAERDKYRTRLEPAAGGGTEIYISHRGLAEVYVNQEGLQTAWQPRPGDPGLEAEFLRRLMVRLGVPKEEAQSKLASAPQAPARAELITGAGGETRLEVREPFDRAWRRVGLALDRVGFTVEDRDRQNGVYFVRYVDPEVEAQAGEDKGLLSRLAFWRDDKVAVKAEQYRVTVVAGGESSGVVVQDRKGEPERSGTAKRILSLLHEQLK